MAVSLDVKFKICEENCTKFIINDTTGTYNALSNPGGWNNAVDGPALADVITDDLKVTYPNGDSVTISLLDVILPFPNTDKSLEKVILNTDLGLPANTQWLSGKYTFERTTTGINNVDGNTFQCVYTLEYWIVCRAWCCVKRMKLAVPKNLDPCCTTNKAKNDADKAWDKLAASEYAFGCGDLNQAQSLLEQVEFLCAQSGSGCC